MHTLKVYTLSIVEIPMEHLVSGGMADEDSDKCEALDVDSPGLGIAETDV